MFLFVNRSGRRIERLRTLVEIHASLPGHLNPNYAVQRAILWQLWEVQLWVTPWFRLVKLYLYAMAGLFLLLFLAGTFPNIVGIHGVSRRNALDVHGSDPHRPNTAVRRVPSAQVPNERSIPARFQDLGLDV
jgi:hypothetical protein